jgi:RimJ/RimL family protein N-acetyltransferase
MLIGERIGLRARHTEDVPILQSGLYDDVWTRSRADSRPWRPVPADSAASPYAVGDPADDVAAFSIVELGSQQLAGEALLWGIDSHNRNAHLGLALLPQFRRRGYGTDTTYVLCHYGFITLGLQRLQLETVTDNHPMIQAATRAGFTTEGTLRRSAWANGTFLDELILGQLTEEWQARQGSKDNPTAT